MYSKKNLPELFARPLIVGASVSADWYAPSPGKSLALRYTGASEIKTIARGGRPGRDVLKGVKESDLADRTIVIGVDLFFWDATLASSHESIKALHQIVEQVTALNIPLVLGEIPELLPGRQTHRVKLSEEIERVANLHDHVFVMPFEGLLEKILLDGFVEFRGKKHELMDLVPDGLHIGHTASDWLADILEQLLVNSLPPIKKGSASLNLFLE